MSRIAKCPIKVPAGIKVVIYNQRISAESEKGVLEYNIPSSVRVSYENEYLQITSLSKDDKSKSYSGTSRALIANMIYGLSKGFEKKLLLIGVGYKAQVSNNKLLLSLGFSHTIEHLIPPGITIETPTQTEIIIKGIDKQLVGQSASVIRSYRPPEPYKGKGIRYADEVVTLKETKKK